MSSAFVFHYPLISGFTLVLGGFALSYVDLRSLSRCNNITAPVYLVSLVAVLVLSYINIMWLPFVVTTGNATTISGTLVFFYLCDMIACCGLDSLYIIRLVACTQMYKYHKFIYLLFIFPALYALGNCLALAAVFHPDNLPFTQAEIILPVSYTLVLGNSTSHIATIVILLRDLGNFKDPKEKRDLKIISAVALTIQVGLIIVAFFSFYDNFVYSNAIWYFLWAGDFIVFNLVNKHIKTFLRSSNLNASHSSRNVTPANDYAHERPAELQQIQTV